MVSVDAALCWKIGAELLGLASSLCLIFPAVALNTHLRAIKQSQDTLSQGATELSRAIAEDLKPVLHNAQIPSWSVRDQRLLVLGIAGLVLSSLVRLGLAIFLP